MALSCPKNPTHEEKLEAVARNLQGESVEKICDELGIHNFKFHGWRKNLASEAQRYIRRKAQPKIISAADTLPGGILGEHVHKARQRRVFTPEQKAYAVEEYRRGTRVQEIAHTFEVTTQQIYSWIKAAPDEPSDDEIKPDEETTPALSQFGGFDYFHAAEKEKKLPIIIRNEAPLLVASSKAPEREPEVTFTEEMKEIEVSRNSHDDSHAYTKEEIEALLDEIDDLKIMIADQMLEIQRLKRGRR